VDRVFLDANVLFSAAYRRDAGLRRLWMLPGVELLTSAYALEEARRNLAQRGQRARLTWLMRALTIVAEPVERPLPEGVDLPAKDRPILLAALDAQATHLLTGDVSHFGRHFGRAVEGVLILPPAAYLAPKEQ
jgi:predicted nucleic acid-binding protein